MSLEPGTRVGAYEILSPIAAGGMGEVYRARDSKLHRDVAVKVLPTHLSESSEALARFEREARAVAALSHPNILAIHDFGKDHDVVFAAMELLEGTTLRERLREGPLPPRKAVEIAGQVAEGLAAAHEKGIVHRDLKPENLFLTRDGRVKVLDFGLAKTQALTRETAATTPVSGDTAVTGAGAVLGTVGYMSPEQVRGLPADHRSDIFSLGVVLHEMLSGERPFQRETPAETLTAILREDPPPLAEVRPPLPPAIVRIVAHCLEKDAEGRFQSARDLAFALASFSQASLSGSLVTPAVVERVKGQPASRWVGLAVLVLAVAAATFEVGRRRSPSSPVSAAFRQLTDLPGVEASPCLSPDGKTLLFVSRVAGNADVYLQRVGGHNPMNLTKDCEKDDTSPAFSRDGERIAFRSECEGGGIFIMGATGETRRRVTDFGQDPSWSPDGRRLVVATEPTFHPLARRTLGVGELWVVEVATGEKRQLSRGDAMQPSWSPGGHRIAYWGLRGGSGQRDLWTVPAGGGEAVEVTNDEAVDWNPVWSPDSRYLYFCSGRAGTMNLWRVPIHEQTGRVSGMAEPVTTPARWSGWVSLSQDGRQLAFADLDERSTLYRAALDPTRGALVGSPSPVPVGSRLIWHHALSRDGQWVAFTSGGLHEHVFVVRVDGTGYRQLTDDASRNRGPEWSPDGGRIAFHSDRGGRYELWAIHPDGSGLERLASAPGGMYFSLWSPEGTRVAMQGDETTRLFDLGRPLEERLVLSLPRLAEGIVFMATSWSADASRLLGWGSRRDGSSVGLFAYSFPSKSYEKLTDAPSDWAVFLSDGRRLLYDDDEGSLSLFDSRTAQARELLPRGTLPPSSRRNFAVSRDDRVITFFRTSREADIWLMTSP